MSVGSHIAELRKKHEALSEEVEVALRTPSFNDLQISEMKKQKLRLKEQIAKLEGAAV